MSGILLANGQANGDGGMVLTNSARRLVSNALIGNVFTSRVDFMRSLLDGTRDIDTECRYKTNPTITDYKHMFDHEGLATRVVQVYPNECFSVRYEVYEDEDPKVVTKFENRWSDLSERLSIQHYLHRADIASGIGSYGILFLGFDDDKEPDQPVSGVDPDTGLRQPGRPPSRLRLNYVRPFDQSLVRVDQFDNNPLSPRSGQPKMYAVKFTTPIDSGNYRDSLVKDSSEKEVKVHWTRVIHVADNRLSSEIFGQPRMQPVFNRLQDIRKILGADGEGFWQTGFPGLSVETQTGLDHWVHNKEQTKEALWRYFNGQQRSLILEGLTAKSLAPTVSDPTNHFNTQLQAVCATLEVPLRVFLGSEEGKLASTQDARTWLRRVSRRQNDYLTPMLIRPLVDRLMLVGVLPRVRKYYVYWPELSTMSPQDAAIVAEKMTKSLVDYLSGRGDAAVPPFEFLTFFLKLQPYEAKAILEAVKVNSDLNKTASSKIEKTQTKPAAQQQAGTKAGGKQSGRTRARGK